MTNKKILLLAAFFFSFAFNVHASTAHGIEHFGYDHGDSVECHDCNLRQQAAQLLNPLEFSDFSLLIFSAPKSDIYEDSQMFRRLLLTKQPQAP
ncbi:MAG: hypothetical protein ACI9LL_000456 [Porticoccus sp.]|jgi:hypothetical protein